MPVISFSNVKIVNKIISQSIGYLFVCKLIPFYGKTEKYLVKMASFLYRSINSPEIAKLMEWANGPPFGAGKRKF